MTDIFVDIGGTHVRYTLRREGTIKTSHEEPVKKFAVAPYGDACGLFGHIRSIEALSTPLNLHISAAGSLRSDGVWRVTNNDDWQIDPDALKAKGFYVQTLVNDFHALARGAVSLPDGGLEVLHKGRLTPDLARAVIGPGTGLGLAYVSPDRHEDWAIRTTQGGHMLAAVYNEEQAAMRRAVQEILYAQDGKTRSVVAEDLASGRGLMLLYKAVCRQTGARSVYQTPAEILHYKDDSAVRVVLRLFHEFLGLFAHNSLIYGSAYGGLYLDGGVLHHMIKSGLFDFETFYQYMDLPVRSTVRDLVRATPVWIIKTPHTALTGLEKLLEAKID